MRVVLQQLGHALTLVSSGQAAVDLVRAGERFDLILLDMHMPGLNGAQTARQIHAQLASHCPPMAAFTADLKSVPADLVATGVFRDCLSKPLNVAHLAQLLEDVINEQQADTRADDIPDLSLYRTAS